MPYYISPPPQSPLARIIAGIIGLFALVGAFMIGMAALLVVVGLGLIAAVAIWLRLAWIKRRLRKSGIDLGVKTNASNTDSAKVSGQVIEAEYTVISKREE